jgi:hypothetical protein
MRRDKTAVERRRRRATERLLASVPPPKRQQIPVPGTANEALRFAASLGWESIPTRDGWRLVHPSGATAMIHKTPSDKRTWNNLRADLIRGARLTEPEENR